MSAWNIAVTLGGLGVNALAPHIAAAFSQPARTRLISNYQRHWYHVLPGTIPEDHSAQRYTRPRENPRYSAWCFAVARTPSPFPGYPAQSS